MLAVVLLTVAACTGSPERPVVHSRTPRFYSSPDLLCGFVPRTPVVAALGTGRIETSGSVSRGAGACLVYRTGLDHPAVEITITSPDPDRESLRGEAGHDGYVYPARTGSGWAHRQYSQTVHGHKVTGALSYLARGEYGILAKLYGPQPGRDAVTDLVAVVTGIVTAVRLP